MGLIHILDKVFMSVHESLPDTKGSPPVSEVPSQGFMSSTVSIGATERPDSSSFVEPSLPEL